MGQKDMIFRMFDNWAQFLGCDNLESSCYSM